MHRRTCVLLAVTAGVLLGAAPAFAVSGGTQLPDQSAAPWMVTIASAGDRPLEQRELCGGVLIAPDRVATAGHCLDHGDPTHWEVHLGASVLSTNPGTVLPIRGVAIHPGYRLIPSPSDPNSFEKSAVANDVAIIALARPVSGVQPVRVAENPPAEGTAVHAYGHGRTKATDPADPLSSIGDVLRRADLSVISDQRCGAQLGGVVDGGSVVCAQGKDTICAGDSGGPLVRDTATGPELVGITSFGGEVVGKQCGQDRYPGGFADTAALRSWLTQPDPVLAPMPVGKPTITGSRAVGDTVRCEQPRWAGKAPDSVAYEWARQQTGSDGFVFYTTIKGATAPRLAITPDLDGVPVLCVQTASTAGGTIEQYTAPR
ncbi:S1 family peptidase [Kutzneria albida]|uniref:Peptidase S1 domain-containing protein n=1 Tax=Kutzneria albida DSM 43870 TaxID=1449976 RepID=W5WCK7_9PSEU|nr:serine protease [Kutzneria albida]AHH98490.1 hypothetical protein KALB_5128 [Kutzneria albida DSM 43870]